MGRYTYVRVELIARPIEAQNDCARFVRWRDDGGIKCPWARRRWRFSFVQRAGEMTEIRQLSADGLRQRHGRRLALSLGSGFRHIEDEMWGGETYE
jgi:hypothetical protein